MTTPIYLDHAATTPLRPEAAAALAGFQEHAANASSAHAWGRRARAALEEARERVAGAIGASRSEIVFTGGGTEANNLAVLGRWRLARRAGARSVICSAIEHSSVLGPCEAAAAEGAELILLGVDPDGRVDAASVDDAVPAAAAVVSVMWGNNEVGTLQDIPALGERCRRAGAVFHTDAVQAFGKVPVRVREAGVDLLSLSGHKIGGPVGVGALYVRAGVELAPLAYGGGQERALRPGTENVAGALAFARAAELAANEVRETGSRLAALRARLETGLAGSIDGLEVNASGAERLPHVASVLVPGIDRESLIVALDAEGVAASTGSACHSGAIEPSHVLAALGRERPDAATLRLSLGRTTTEREIDDAARRIAGVVDRLRALAEA